MITRSHDYNTVIVGVYHLVNKSMFQMITLVKNEDEAIFSYKIKIERNEGVC